MQPSPARIVLAHLQLIHLVPVLFVMTATALFGLLASGWAPDPSRYLLMLAAMLGGQVTIGVLNELRDAEYDARHQPWKPLPAGLVSRRITRPVITAALLIALISGAALGTWPFLLLVIGTGCGVVYDLWLKRTPFSGIPYLVALPLLPIWAWLIMDGFEPRLLWLYPFGGLFVLAIHLAQSLPDIQGDRASGARGLAVVLGYERAHRAIWAIAASTTLLMPVGAWLVGGRPVYALGASLGAGAIFSAAVLLGLERGRMIDTRPMEILAGVAILLAIGWILAVTG